jgi:hypothetical protein
MLDFMDWVAVVGFITLAVALSIAAIGEVVLCIRGTKDQPDPEGLSRLKIPADCPKCSYDYIVDLECPDGTVVRVKIPIDPNSYTGKCSRVSGPSDPPVGLNLVCSDHYT